MKKKLYETLVLISVLITSFALIPSVTSQSPLQYDPQLDLKRWIVMKGPDAQLISMQIGLTDVWKGLWRSGDIEALSLEGFTITSTPGFHMCHVGFNMRKWYFGPQDGSNPGQALRHAIAHLIPKDEIIATLKQYTANPLDTVVPPAMRECHNPNVDPHPYNCTHLAMGEGIQVLYVPPDNVTLFAGGSDPGCVYKYLGEASWEVISPDLGKAVLSLVEHGGALYAGTKSYDGIGQVYRYDGGTSWTLVGDTMDAQVSSLIVWNGALYAGTVPWAILFRYNAPYDWTRVFSRRLPNGIRSMYVWEADNALYLGDFNSDKILRYNGVDDPEIVLDKGRSCIWDFQSYGGDLYASAWHGYVYKSSNGFDWTEVDELSNSEGRNIWALEVFQGALYLGMDWMGDGTREAKLCRYDGMLLDEVWTTGVIHQAEGIISMATNGSTLFVGLGGEEGYYESGGAGQIYGSDDGWTFQQISELGAPISAAEMLLEAGWLWNGTHWLFDGTPLPTIEFLSPTYEVDPQKAEIVAVIVTEMQAVALPDGTPAPLPVVHQPTEACHLDDLVFNLHDYDMAILNLDTGKHPDYLYDYFHSSQDFPGGHNFAGINNITLDAKLETILFSLDHDEKMDACHNVQVELMGDLAYTYENITDGLIPWVPIYSKVIFDAFRPQLEGMVMSPGFGTHNRWTNHDLHWTTLGGLRPGTGDSMVHWILNDEPCSFNPLYVSNPYGWQIMSEIFDPIIMQNPFTHKHKPWIATDWEMVETPDGMNVTYWLRDDVYWQDGHPYTADHAEFSLMFLRNNAIPRYMSSCEHIVDVEVHNPYSFSVISDVTSQFLIYEWANLAAMLAPQVWSIWDGQPLADILGYDPSTDYTDTGPWSYPDGPDGVPGTGDDPDPANIGPKTCVMGTGPFVYDFYDPVGQVAEVHAWREQGANVGYFMTTAEIQDQLVEMLWMCGDVDGPPGSVPKSDPGWVWVNDKYRVGWAYGSTPGDPSWDPYADLNSDGIVGFVDSEIVSYYFGSRLSSMPLPPRWDSTINYVTIQPGPQPEIADILVAVESQGYDPIGVDVSVYYDSNLIGTRSADLGLGTDILTFPWNTTEVPNGIYTITATSSIYPCEIDPNDNAYVDGKVSIVDGEWYYLLSDIRGPGPGNPPDGVVDGWDYGFIGLAFGTKIGDPNWDNFWIADIRGPEYPPGSGRYPPDGVVDGWDYGYCGLQFGQHI